jgi:hypothetical protein
MNLRDAHWTSHGRDDRATARASKQREKATTWRPCDSLYEFRVFVRVSGCSNIKPFEVRGSTILQKSWKRSHYNAESRNAAVCIRRLNEEHRSFLQYMSDFWNAAFRGPPRDYFALRPLPASGARCPWFDIVCAHSSVRTRSCMQYGYQCLICIHLCQYDNTVNMIQNIVAMALQGKVDPVLN